MSQTADIMIAEPPKLGIFDLERLHGFKVLIQVLIFSGVCAALLLDLPHVRPLKLSSVYLHEQGHALMTWITQGEVVGIKVHADNESGETTSKRTTG